MNHYKETIRLGVPIMLGQLGIIVVNFADNIMVGHHSTQELAAASFVNNFFNLAFIFGMGFSYGLTPIIGRLFAQGNREEAGATLKSSLVINLAIGILLSLCMLFLLLNLDWLNQPKELYPYILPYYMLQLFSVIFAMLFNAFKQFSDGTTDTLTPMYIMLSANILNIIGNYFLIYGHGGFPELGLTGAGISTLFSRILTFVVFFFLFFKRQKYAAYLKGFRAASVSKERILNLARLGLPVGFQMGVETASFSLSVIMMGWLGSIALAAYQVAGVITTLGFMLYYGIGAAVSIRVSNFYGNHNSREIHQAVKAGFHYALQYVVVSCFPVAIPYTDRLSVHSGIGCSSFGCYFLLAYDVISIRRCFTDFVCQCLARIDRCTLYGQNGTALPLWIGTSDWIPLWIYLRMGSARGVVWIPDQSDYVGASALEALRSVDEGKMKVFPFSCSNIPHAVM